MKKAFFIILVLVIIGIIGWSVFGSKTTEAPESTTVTRGDLTSSISINATLPPVRYANIGSEILAEVTEVNVDVGVR